MTRKFATAGKVDLMLASPKSPRVLGIILARMGSLRLPGKMMLPIHGARLIDYVIARARRIQGLDELVLATTDGTEDDCLAEYVAALGVKVFRGDSLDVAKRVMACADQFECDYFVRLNGDSPFLDYRLLAEALATLMSGSPDLVTNLLGRTYPYGIAVEIVKTDTYRRAISLFSDEAYREHVTSYFYSHIEDFSVKSLTSNRMDLLAMRLVVDTEEDLRRMGQLVASLGAGCIDATLDEIGAHYRRFQ